MVVKASPSALAARFLGRKPTRIMKYGARRGRIRSRGSLLRYKTSVVEWDECKEFLDHPPLRVTPKCEGLYLPGAKEPCSFLRTRREKYELWEVKSQGKTRVVP